MGNATDFVKNTNIAIVHDWLTGMRGGEKVLTCLLELFPDADLFTLLHNPGSVSDQIENRKSSRNDGQKQWHSRN